MKNALARLTGMGAASTAALAVLVLGCVFAASTAPREALASKTQALRQTLAATIATTRAITVSSTWIAISDNLANAKPRKPHTFTTNPTSVNVTAGQLGEITGQLHDDFDRGVIQLAGGGQDWVSLTSGVNTVLSSLPAVGAFAVKLEVSYRQPLYQYTRLVAGRYPGSAAPGVLQVVVSQQIARQFGLHPGSQVKIAAVTLDITGIVAARDPGSTFWAVDPVLLTPDLECVSCLPTSIWYGGVFAGPGEIDAMQHDFGLQGIAFQWEFPLAIGSLGGAPAQQMHDTLNRLGVSSPPLTGGVAPISGVLQVNSGLAQTLGAFLSTAQAVNTLLWLLYVSLAVAGAVTLLLAARMVALRRSAELAMRRARGASLPQIAWVAARGAAIACVPAAALAAILAVLLVPGPAPAGGWWPAAVTLLVGVCAPAAIATWQQRTPRRRARDRRRSRGQTRLVLEATACLAAIAGVTVFRQQGSPPGAGVNLYTSAAPVLVAVPAVIVVLRLYPLVLRGLLRGSAMSAGATAFLGLARTARTRLTPALPAFALVLALTIAAFAGMVRDAVSTGDVTASWQAAGADVMIRAATQQAVQTQPLPAAAVRELTAAPGVTHAATVWQADWSTAAGFQVTGLVVDPAQYAALVADTRTFPAVPAALLAAPAAGAPQPVLASSQAAAGLEAGVSTLSSLADVAPIRIRVAGVLSGTPALPGGGAFVIIPAAAIRSTATPPQPAAALVNEMLLGGGHIDTARVTAVMKELDPAGVTTFRSDILEALTGAPLQHGTFVLFELALIAAAVLGLAVMLLELALGAAERETTLARLAAMGLGEGQRVRVVVLEVLPAVIAAGVAAGACALVLPQVVAPAIDLSVFTGPALGGVALAPDVASVLLPLAGLAVAATVALGVEIRSRRRRGVAASLRPGG